MSPNMDAHTQHQIYNGLDCCLTFEIFEVLEKQLREKNDPASALVYQFERGMQGPALELMERGWLIDPADGRLGGWAVVVATGSRPGDCRVAACAARRADVWA